MHIERQLTPVALSEIAHALIAPAIFFVMVKRGRGEEWETARYGTDRPRWFTYWEPEDFDKMLVNAGFTILEGEILEDDPREWILRLCRIELKPEWWKVRDYFLVCRTRALDLVQRF